VQQHFNPLAFALPDFQMPPGTLLFDSTGARLDGVGQITTSTTSSRQIQLSARFSF
jgi:hypothetical protein